MWVGEKALVSGACVGLYARVFVSVTSSACLKARMASHGTQDRASTASRGPEALCVCPTSVWAFAHTGCSTRYTLPAVHQPTSRAALYSLAEAPSPGCPHPVRPSLKPVLGHHGLLGLVYTRPGVTVRSLSASLFLASSGGDWICWGAWHTVDTQLRSVHE